MDLLPSKYVKVSYFWPKSAKKSFCVWRVSKKLKKIEKNFEKILKFFFHKINSHYHIWIVLTSGVPQITLEDSRPVQIGLAFPGNLMNNVDTPTPFKNLEKSDFRFWINYKTGADFIINLSGVCSLHSVWIESAQSLHRACMRSLCGVCIESAQSLHRVCIEST